MAMHIVTGPAAKQNSQEWHAWRSRGIGASEAPAIMGTSKFRTAYELFRIRRGIGPPLPSNHFLDRIRARGHQLEPIARAAYERHTGTTVTPLIAESAANPIIRASFDGYNAFDSIPVEIKCPGEAAHALALKGVIPPEYVDQIQQQIFVAESKFAHYYSFDGEKGVLLRVPRNQTRIDEILRADEDFWNRLQNGKWATDEWEAAAAVWQSANHELQAAQAREESARALLKAQMPKGVKRHEGHGVSVLMGQRKGQVDWRKLFEDLGINMTESQLDQYRKATTDSVTVRELPGGSPSPGMTQRHQTPSIPPPAGPVVNGNPQPSDRPVNDAPGLVFVF